MMRLSGVTALLVLGLMAPSLVSALSVWPQPAALSTTSGTMTFTDKPTTVISPPLGGDAGAIAEQAVTRFVARTFDQATTASSSSSSSPGTGRVSVHVRGRHAAAATWTLNVNVASGDVTLGEGTDESYTLVATQDKVDITAKTVFGLLHALESLSQMITFNFDTAMYQIDAATVDITDAPRFVHRGLLVDTSRHFQPLASLKRVIDSMTYAKLNVLHWHIVDAQSFPVESKTYPKLWTGSWTPSERYTQADVTAIIQYALYRGVRVIPEFDGPGHAYAWGIGYPEILPTGYQTAPNCENKCPPQAGNPCDVPLDPSNNATMKLVNDFLTEMADSSAGLFTDAYLHLGGDEVQLGCWENSPQIKQFMNEHGWTNLTQLYMYYVQSVHVLSFKLGKTPVNWEEVFNYFGTKLDKRTIIQIWLDHKTLAKVVAAGYKAILSNQDVWYLDHLSTTWQQFYDNEPFENPNITDPTQQSLVLGGEVCMWGETVDASDIEQTIWPRAAAGAERMWTARTVIGTSAQAESRLETFRCLLTRRGIAAAPVTVAGRAAPSGPGACPYQ